MESECDGFKWQNYRTYDLGPEHPLEVFDLFIQWLYTRKYQEKEGLAWSFDKCPTLLSSSLEIDVTPYFRVDWPVKAAIASWELGVTLRAKGFQNYAIKRLFEAFSRPLSQPLTPALCLRTSPGELCGRLIAAATASPGCCRSQLGRHCYHRPYSPRTMVILLRLMP